MFDFDPRLLLLGQVVVDVICPLKNLLTGFYSSNVNDLSSFQDWTKVKRLFKDMAGERM